MSRVDFFLSTRKTKVGLLIELSTMVPLDHAVLNGKVVGSHQAYGIPVPGGARAGGRGAPVGEPSGPEALSHTCHLVPVCWWCGRLRPPCRRPTQIQAYRGPRARALCRTRRRRRFTPVPGRSRRAIRGYPRTAPTRRPRDAESGQILALLHRDPTFFGDYPRRGSRPLPTSSK